MNNNLNILNERKISNSSMISTSLNGPTFKQRNSTRNNDICSNITKKEWAYGNQNNKEKYDINLNNELNKLNEIYYNKKIELNDVIKEYHKNVDIYNKKNYTLLENKKKYEALKQKNLNLKLMIMNIMKIKNINKDK
jgi:hypothetical protein